MHKICHRAIHAMLSERELAEEYAGFEKLRTHPMLAQFIAWVKKRPPEYYDRTRWSRSRRFKDTLLPVIPGARSATRDPW